MIAYYVASRYLLYILYEMEKMQEKYITLQLAVVGYHILGSIALLWHNAKVLALLKVKYEIH